MYFFFFKQKTAYEMRISDWSSDVCSSDLYPQKPVTFYFGFSAGGPTDTVGRLLADKLSQKLGQTFVVENKVGSSGVVAANLVKKAEPDGYTLMLGSSSTLSIIPHVQKSVQYDALKDFTSIALVASYPYYLAVPEDSQFKTFHYLISYGRHKSTPQIGNACCRERGCQKV